MDRTLLAWGLRRDRARGAPRPGAPPKLPRLWLFTDLHRLPDPRAAVANLPRGRAGVVLRHDTDPGRGALGRELARICRARRLILVVAGDLRLAAALRAGVHLRGGRWPGFPHLRGVITSSAHSVADVLRASRVGADLVFLSPAFPTSSHPGASGLGPLRWGATTRRLPERRVPTRLAALGGVDGKSVRRLGKSACYAAGAITALAP